MEDLDFDNRGRKEHMLLLFLLLSLGTALVMRRLMHAKPVQQLVQSSAAVRSHLPKMISALIIVTHASEITRMIENISIIHIVAAVLLLCIYTASKPGTETELP